MGVSTGIHAFHASHIHVGRSDWKMVPVASALGRMHDMSSPGISRFHSTFVFQVAAVSQKTNTTFKPTLGAFTEGSAQVVLFDTPGIISR